MTDEMSEQGAAGLDPTSVTLDDGTSALALDLTGVPGFDTLVFNTPDGSQVLVSDIGEGAQLIAVDADGQGGIDRAFVAVSGHSMPSTLRPARSRARWIPRWCRRRNRPRRSRWSPCPRGHSSTSRRAPPRRRSRSWAQGPTSATRRRSARRRPGLRAHRRPDEGRLRRRPGLERIDDPTRVGYVGGPVFEPIDDPTKVGYFDPIPNFPTIGDSSQQGTITWNDSLARRP